MSTIVVSTANTTLSTDQTHFTLRSNGRKIGRIPPGIIDQVVVFHGVDVTRTALSRLRAMGIPVTFPNQEGRVEARLVPAWKYDATARLGQAKAFFDPATRLLLARRWVDAKLANAAAVIRLHAGNHPNPVFSDCCRKIRELRAPAARASALDELMGGEGMAGRIYFQALGGMLRVKWTEFHGRTRRPPLDPTNAVLSYAYAVLTHQLMAYAESLGLDPYIGYLHTMESRRPTLALDMLEPFRPVLGDRLMLRLMNLAVLRQEHFAELQGPGNGIFINFEGRQSLVRAFVEWSEECDQTLGPNYPSPGFLLLKEIEKFTACAKRHALEEFSPYYLIEEDRPDTAANPTA